MSNVVQSTINRNVTNHQCEKCNYSTFKKSSWDKHVTSKKHLDEEVVYQYVCEVCDKTYKGKSGLWKHNKICGSTQPSSSEYLYITTEVINQNKALTKMVATQAKLLEDKNKELADAAIKINTANAKASNNHSHNTTNSHSHNTSNSHNTHFNLQFFLNETCKDAINMKDFIKSIVIELSDLKNVQKVGYTDGMTAIITNALDSLDENKRPIHCSDLKRETMYIKEGDVWEKENEEKTNMKDMIRYVEHKNIKKIPEWVDDNPGCTKGDHKDNTTYLKMVQQVTGGNLEKNDENVDKIIHNIAKTVTIDKNV